MTSVGSGWPSAQRSATTELSCPEKKAKLFCLTSVSKFMPFYPLTRVRDEIRAFCTIASAKSKNALNISVVIIFTSQSSY